MCRGAEATRAGRCLLQDTPARGHTHWDTDWTGIKIIHPDTALADVQEGKERRKRSSVRPLQNSLKSLTGTIFTIYVNNY